MAYTLHKLIDGMPGPMIGSGQNRAQMLLALKLAGYIQQGEKYPHKMPKVGHFLYKLAHSTDRRGSYVIKRVIIK